MFPCMTRWKKPPALMLIAVVLLALLPLLAGLQYHWLGQLSENERERMRNNLTAGVARFSEDFDRELTRIYSMFQQLESFDPNSSFATKIGASDAERLFENMARWRTTPRAGLIKDVYIADELTVDSGPRLRRFDVHRKTLDLAEWSDELLPLRAQITRHLLQQNAQASHAEFVLPSVLSQELPVIVIPRITAYKVEVAKETFWEKSISREHARVAGSFVVAVLDRTYIEETFLPDLTRTYFSDGDEIEYNVAIIHKKDPEKFLYMSDPALPRSVFSTPDATRDIFGLRMDNLIFMHDTVNFTKGFRAKVQEDVVEVGAIGGSVNFILGQSWHPEASAGKFVTSSMTPESEWQLAVKHRAGSLEGAVGNARLRNLGISFGILLLLGISVLTMLVTTHRAQRLAGQQIAFVAGVSHELRTPLAVIRSAGENLADGVIDDIEHSRRYGTIIRNEGRRLSEMVEKILDFAGIQSQRKNYELRPTDVSEVVKAAIEESAGLLNSTGFQVATEIPAGSTQILADPSALKSAIQNLISNAVKYSNGNKWIRLIVERHEDSVEVRIQDRGIGIPPSDLPHIFEPFYRGREVVDAQIQGSGLGLSLVKHFIEGHKGTIMVDSFPRQGTTFTMRLPATSSKTRN